MAYLPAGSRMFDHVPVAETYTSPFPSTFSNPKLAALGGLSAAVLAKQGAYAWATATQIALKQKAVFVGDLRTDWLRNLVPPGTDQEALRGVFAQISFPTSMSAGAFRSAMVDTGFDVASKLLTAVPVGGPIISAVLDAARFFAKLGGRGPEEQQAIVPWAEYSRDLDEDVVRTIVLPAMETVDWTQLFWPALAWDSTGFRMLETAQGDDTRAWGSFTGSGAVNYTTTAPGALGGTGLGFMPGSQRIADVVQMKIRGLSQGQTGRKDAITEVGSFFPATAQTCTALWEMVAKAGNPDMFKVRAGQLGSAWASYFETMRGDFKSRWYGMMGGGDTFDGPINLGKLVSPFLLSNGIGVDLSGQNGMTVWPGMSRKDGAWQPDPKDGRPGCLPEKDRSGDAWWSKGWSSDIYTQAGVQWPPSRCQGVNVNSTLRAKHWKWMDQAIITPACTRLKQAQHRALYRTTICAYVRPQAFQGLAAYGAFLDDSPALTTGHANFGEELVARCLHAREVMLTRDLRYSIRLEDVDAIDPGFAAQLRASGVDEDSWKKPRMRISAAQGLPDTDKVPPSDGPRGGSPFGLESANGGGGGAIIAGGIAVGLFALLSAL